MQEYEEIHGPRFEIDINSSEYPPILRDTPDPPRRIYGIGNAEALQPGIAIIGSRKASPYGLACTEFFARQVAKRGITIISGGARGCDQAAHKMALEEGAPTVVVLGSGANIVYPKRGKDIFTRIVEQGGAIISENDWGMPPMRGLFVRRNRIIAGLAALVIISEAGLPSGTFSTADAALQANHDVAAVPGAISSPNSRGANHLLSQGAFAVTDLESLDTAIDLAFAHNAYTLLSERAGKEKLRDVSELTERDPVLRALAAEALSAQELSAYFDFTPGELSRQLAQYELHGLIQRGYDGRYQMCPQTSAMV